MPLAFVPFLLIAVHGSVMVDSKPWLHTRDPRTPLSIPAQAQPSFTEASQRNSERPDFLVILPVKTHDSNFVSIFDLRRKRYLCMDHRGELFNLRQRDTEDCLFQRLWLDWPNKHDVFYSIRAARLLKIRGVEVGIVKWESAGIPVGVRRLEQMLKRQKRSQQVNPSDPFRAQAHPLPAKPQEEPDQPNRDQSGAVSKETITSYDDPLKVLQTNVPGSPVKGNIGDQAEDAKIVLAI